MYSQSNVFNRFSGAKPLAGNAINVIAVRFENSNWKYNNNATWVTFTQSAQDVLMVGVDFSLDNFVNHNSVYQGIKLGYKDGDVSFLADTWAGSANNGEFGVAGSWFNLAPFKVSTKDI